MYIKKSSQQSEKVWENAFSQGKKHGRHRSYVRLSLALASIRFLTPNQSNKSGQIVQNEIQMQWDVKGEIQQNAMLGNQIREGRKFGGEIPSFSRLFSTLSCEFLNLAAFSTWNSSFWPKNVPTEFTKIPFQLLKNPFEKNWRDSYLALLQFSVDQIRAFGRFFRRFQHRRKWSKAIQLQIFPKTLKGTPVASRSQAKTPNGCQRPGT